MIIESKNIYFDLKDLLKEYNIKFSIILEK